MSLSQRSPPSLTTTGSNSAQALPGVVFGLCWSHFFLPRAAVLSCPCVLGARPPDPNHISVPGQSFSHSLCSGPAGWGRGGELASEARASSLDSWWMEPCNLHSNNNPVFVSSGCRDSGDKLGGLKQQEIYSLSVLETEVQNETYRAERKAWAGSAPSAGCWGECISCNFQLGGGGGCIRWLVAPSL